MQYSFKYFPSHLLPKLSQPSKISCILYFLEISINLSKSGGLPKTGDIKIPRVLLVILDSN